MGELEKTQSAILRQRKGEGVCIVCHIKGIAKKDMAHIWGDRRAVCLAQVQNNHGYCEDAYTEDELKNLNSKIIMHWEGWGNQEEIAAAVCFLAVKEAGYITRQPLIDVNGGFYIGS